MSLCAAVLVVAALAAAVEPARACSCVPPDPWSYLEKADGAFVGRLVSRQEGDEGRAVLTFSVERAVKGKIGRTVEVETASSGAACGIETSVGRRIGLFLVREGDGWFGLLCWQVEPEELLAAASLPAPNGRGPVALFVGGRFGPARTLALDRKGRTLAYGLGAGYVQAFSVCPGGRRVAELVGDTPYGVDFVAMRELPTLRLIRQQPVKVVYAEELACVNASGEQLAVFFSDTAARGRLRRVTPRSATTLWRGSAFYTAFWKHFAYVQALDPGGTTLIAVDVRTGIAKKLGTVSIDGIYQLAPNRVGTKLASDSYAEGSGDPRLVVIDLGRRPIAARTIPMPVDFGDVVWLSDDRFAYLAKDKILVFTSQLQLSARISGWRARSTTVLRSRLVGVSRLGRLLQAQLPSGRIRVVRRLPGEPYVIVSATG